MTNSQPRYCRNPDILERQVDGDVFLINDEVGRIHALESMAGGIWRLLDEPLAVHEIVTVFASAFPAFKPKELRRNVNRLMGQLEHNGLTQRIN